MTIQVNNQRLIPSTDVTQLTLTLKMITAQVVEMTVTVNYNSPIQDYVHVDDDTQPTYEMTSGFKTLTVFIVCCSNSSRASPLKDNKRSRIVLIKKKSNHHLPSSFGSNYFSAIKTIFTCGHNWLEYNVFDQKRFAFFLHEPFQAAATTY